MLWISNLAKISMVDTWPVAIVLLLMAAGWLWMHLRRWTAKVGSSAALIIEVDHRGTVVTMNPAAREALGYSQGDVLSLDDLHAEGGLRRKDGSILPALVADSDGLCLAIDRTEKKAREDALRERQEMLESVSLFSPAIVMIFDLDAREVLYTNRPLPADLGYGEEMGNDPLPTVLHPEDLDLLVQRYESCAQLLDGQVHETELRCLDSGGQMRWIHTRDVVFRRDADGRACQILSNIVDTTEKRRLDEQIEAQVLEIHDTNLALEIQTNALEEANAQLESLAFTDGLTSIPNHRSFQEELSRAFRLARRKNHRLSLMIIDVDHFKQYNDTYGHPSGDLILKRVATLIRESCPSLCTPARYGGEEFVVLCPEFTAREVLELAERIRSTIEATPWPEMPLTVSIGAVSLSHDVGNPSELVNSADLALYSSKASGRNCVTFYDHARRAA